MRVRALFLFFLFPQVLLAEYKGLDLLGLAMQDCQMLVETLPSNTAVGVLEGTFGDPLPCLERLIKAGKVSAVRVHLINGPCWRNKNCEADEPVPSDRTALRVRALKYQQFFDRHKLPCFISPVLEHDIRDWKLVDAVFKTVRAAAPSCTLVQSAYKGVRLRGILNEQHGNGAKGEITSNDGESIFDINSGAYADSGSIITFAWFHSLSLRALNEVEFIPPKIRVNKATREEVAKALLLIGKNS